MYYYKFVEVAHSWTGKPKENIEAIIEDHAEGGWRLSQIFQDIGSALYASKTRTKIIFEKEVDAQFYQSAQRQSLDEDSFV